MNDIRFRISYKTKLLIIDCLPYKNLITQCLCGRMWAREQAMSKTAGREGVRLWFEFVKRAHADKTVRLNTAFYKAWGD